MPDYEPRTHRRLAPPATLRETLRVRYQEIREALRGLHVVSLLLNDVYRPATGASRTIADRPRPHRYAKHSV